MAPKLQPQTRRHSSTANPKQIPANERQAKKEDAPNRKRHGRGRSPRCPKPQARSAVQRHGPANPKQMPANKKQTNWRATLRWRPNFSRDCGVIVQPRIQRKSTRIKCLKILGLRFASFAPAHIALRAACGRLPGQRPLARVPVSGLNFPVSLHPHPSGCHRQSFAAPLRF